MTRLFEKVLPIFGTRRCSSSSQRTVLIIAVIVNLDEMKMLPFLQRHWQNENKLCERQKVRREMWKLCWGFPFCLCRRILSRTDFHSTYMRWQCSCAASPASGATPQVNWIRLIGWEFHQHFAAFSDAFPIASSIVRSFVRCNFARKFLWKLLIPCGIGWVASSSRAHSRRYNNNSLGFAESKASKKKMNSSCNKIKCNVTLTTIQQKLVALA